MPLSRVMKEQIVSELHGKFQKAQVAILTDYCGLNVEEINRLRKELRTEQVEYRVVKNTILRLAAKGTDFELLNDHFEGPSAIAMSYDEQKAPAEVLTKFIKGCPKLEIKAGVLEGKIMTPKQVKLLAELPSRDVLLAQMLSSLVSNHRGLVGVLNGILLNFLNTLEAIREKKKE